jgi:tRNA(Ile)-lysidine synthase TilS/MesJ
MTSTTIQDFWFAHERYWFPVSAREKLEADFEITKLFWNYNVCSQNLIGQIIYYDQFSRHFQRAGLLTNGMVEDDWRWQAVILADKVLLDDKTDERVIVWSLMPYKHVGLLEQALEKAAPFLQDDRPLLRRFFEDTYKKYYTEECVARGLVRNGLRSVSYKVSDICEEVGSLVLPRQIEQPHDIPLTELVASFVDIRKKVVVSLSGGIDSMLLCYLYNLLGYSVTAVHIIYGNRAESEQEYSFIADFCDDLGIPIVAYRIPWLRRATASREFVDSHGEATCERLTNVSREFYERMTREIRFMVYRLVAGEAPVVLGHIRDDIVENIMTNFVRGDHLNWLGAMTTFDTQMGVRLVRPFLDVDKKEIYAVARQVGLSWLKNTTPSWSNRGKFREKFHSALVEQYGAGIDNALVEMAKRIAAQASMLESLLYLPIQKSWVAEKMELDITVAIEAQLEPSGWMRIFEFVCHDNLGVRKPTLAAAGEFIRRVDRLRRTEKQKEKIKINMSKGLVFLVEKSGKHFKMIVELS